MRNTTFLDWFLEALLLAIFCGVVTLVDHFQTQKDPINTMYWVAGSWAGFGLLRYVWKRIKAANTPPTP